MSVNENEPDLRGIWQQIQPKISESLTEQVSIPRNSCLPGERFRRRLIWDTLYKLIIVLAFPVAWMLMDRPEQTLVFFLVGLFFLCVILGIWQWVWVRSWPDNVLGQNLNSQLKQDLNRWDRRIVPLSFLLGATPALVWQLQQLIYYAFTKGRLEPSGLRAWFFALAGGPVLWIIASWVSYARIKVWLLQIEQALSIFSDQEYGERLALARSKRNSRVLIMAMILVLLLVMGLLLLL